MTPLEFWRYKVLQTLHDPFHKMAVQGLMKHGEAAWELIQKLTRESKRFLYRAPDRLATGADRPVVGDGTTCRVHWPTDPIVTHPLQPLKLHVQWDALPAGKGAKTKAEKLDEQVQEALQPLALSPGDWDSASEVRGLLLKLWRRTPELMREIGLQAPFLPADSRCPDHSLWEHTRVASAASFLVEMKDAKRPPEREPWMLAFTLGGVQRFLQEARKSRDLWTASMIYADLAWAALLPVVEKLGPDAVLYPDLRANPFADRWLLAAAPEAVPEAVKAGAATTHAAMLPNTFVVLAPRGGGDSGLPDLEALARECAEGVRKRWRALADLVEAWIGRRADKGPWKDTWARQVNGRLGEPPVSWVAVPWERRMVGIGEAIRGPALPGQAPGQVQSPWPEQLLEREEALAPWLPDRVWVHYEMARDVFWHVDSQTKLTYLSAERGFDYPLVHHQLRQALSLRKASALPRPLEEPGEKCSITGREEVLSLGERGNGPLVARRREGARQFWKPFDAEGEGAERLGSTAAIKRYLVRAAEPAFTATWESPEERQARGKKEPRAPFPSMAAIAAGTFLESLGQAAALPEVAQAIQRFLAAFRAAELEETVDPRALPALARAARTLGMEELLQTEPEMLFPETLEILERRAKPRDPARAELLKELRNAAVELRKKAAKVDISPPRKLVAVLRMDGDALGKLILGDPAVIRTSWQDVLHPKAVEQVRDKLASTGWSTLLGEKRHMGPALHSAVTRALGDFAHKMVAWVVEREFNGRLIYAGGDDLLALLPAVEAISAAARLQQLFSAPYVLDTEPDADPWAWRREGRPGPTSEARQRFRVPVASEGTIRLSERQFEPHAAGGPTSSELPEGRSVSLHIMLGRAQGLSAGITIGHYKTPLATMLRTAGEMLDGEAKGRLGRGALATTLLGGEGSKAVFGGKWHLGEEGGDFEPPDVQTHVMRLVEGFTPRPSQRAERAQGSEATSSDREALRAARLPGRAPYKLRERIDRIGAVLLDEKDKDLRDRLIRRLVQKETGLKDKKQRDEDLLESGVKLLEVGLRYAGALLEAKEITLDEVGQHAVAGWLVARKLATDGGGDGPA